MGKKFCNANCEMKYNNQRTMPGCFDNVKWVRLKKRLEVGYVCKNCNSPINSFKAKKFCSKECRIEFKIKDIQQPVISVAIPMIEIHSNRGIAKVEMRCPCGNIFVRERRHTHLVKHRKFNNTHCSRFCFHRFKSANTVIIREFREF
jgi:hypothetical protein